MCNDLPTPTRCWWRTSSMRVSVIATTWLLHPHRHLPQQHRHFRFLKYSETRCFQHRQHISIKTRSLDWNLNRTLRVPNNNNNNNNNNKQSRNHFRDR
jgi:hypothetical protein